MDEADTYLSMMTKTDCKTDVNMQLHDKLIIILQ